MSTAPIRPEVDADAPVSTLLPDRWFGRIRTGRQVALVWVVSRLIIGLIYATPAESYIAGDPYYYFNRLAEMAEKGLGLTMREYPIPALWLLQLPELLTGGNLVGYVVGFAMFMLALDAVFTLAVWRAAGRRRSAGLDLWLLLVVAIGPLAYFRFDMIPAVLLGGALLFSRTRPLIAGALVAAGAAVKLWPALVFPALMARRGRGRPGTTIGFVVVGVGLALISLIIAGWTRLVSPLTWQSDRGLQIESIPATVLIAIRTGNPELWDVDLSQYNAYEFLDGPGISALLVLATVLTVLGLATIAVMLLRAYRHPAIDSWHIALLVLAIVLIMIVTNKTLSPQYVVWLGGPLAYLLLTAADDDQRLAVSRRLAVLGLVVCLLTHLVYPLFYTSIYTADHPWMPITSWLLVLRNLVLLGFTGWVVALAFRLPEPLYDDPDEI